MFVYLTIRQHCVTSIKVK